MLVFFFNDTATTEIYTLSLHDALPISACQTIVGDSIDLKQGRDVQRCFPTTVTPVSSCRDHRAVVGAEAWVRDDELESGDRKSTRLNSSHANISYAVFCLKKKKHACHD